MTAFMKVLGSIFWLAATVVAALTFYLIKQESTPSPTVGAATALVLYLFVGGGASALLAVCGTACLAMRRKGRSPVAKSIRSASVLTDSSEPAGKQ